MSDVDITSVLRSNSVVSDPLPNCRQTGLGGQRHHCIGYVIIVEQSVPAVSRSRQQRTVPADVSPEAHNSPTPPTKRPAPAKPAGPVGRIPSCRCQEQEGGEAVKSVMNAFIDPKQYLDLVLAYAFTQGNAKMAAVTCTAVQIFCDEDDSI